jgi:hypothetical protein
MHWCRQSHPPPKDLHTSLLPPHRQPYPGVNHWRVLLACPTVVSYRRVLLACPGVERAPVAGCCRKVGRGSSERRHHHVSKKEPEGLSVKVTSAKAAAKAGWARKIQRRIKSRALIFRVYPRILYPGEWTLYCVESLVTQLLL